MNASAPLVSVVIPVFNGMPYLPATVESIERQTYGNLEIALVDGGSTDDSRSWLDSLDSPRIRVIKQDEKLTAAENWTRAVEAANGEFVKLVCQDDELLPQCIADQIEALSTCHEAVMVASRRTVVNEHGDVLIKSRGLAGLHGEVNRATVLAAICRKGTNVLGEPASVMFRAEALKAELPWSQEWPYALDVEMYMRVLKHGTLVALPKTLARFRVSDSQWSSRLVRDQADQFCSWLSAVAGDEPAPQLSRAQLARGLAAARVMQQLRRAVYSYNRFKQRRRAEGATTG